MSTRSVIGFNEKDVPLIAHIIIHGDITAGIPDSHITVEWHGSSMAAIDDIECDRERIRGILTGAFSEIEETSVEVRWYDECPDCGHVHGHGLYCPSSATNEGKV